MRHRNREFRTMGGHHHRDIVLTRMSLKLAAELIDLGHVKTGGGLVEPQQTALGQQGSGGGQLAILTATEGWRQLARIQAKIFKKLCNLTVVGPHQMQILTDLEVRQTTAGLKDQCALIRGRTNVAGDVETIVAPGWL